MAIETNIQVRRGLASEWSCVNPTLAAGEPGFETDTRKFKIGDGTTVWNSLEYIKFDGGDLDASSNACCTEAPGKPTGLNYLGGIVNYSIHHGMFSARFNWNPPASTGGYISNYVLQWRRPFCDGVTVNSDIFPEDTTWVTIGEQSNATTTPEVPILTSVAPGCPYSCYIFRVAAVNTCGQGPWSDYHSLIANCPSSSSSSSASGSSSSAEVSCPAPWMNILLSDGTLVPAGELKAGMMVRTKHEDTMEMGSYEVTHVSKSHKFYVEGSWKEAESLLVGDLVGESAISSIENIGAGEVVKITVDVAHTYICEGLLSHNKTPIYARFTGTNSTVSW